MVVTDGLHRVTGELVTDATGDYLPHIIHNGKMSYRRLDGAYFIWWHLLGDWYLSDMFDDMEEYWWVRSDPDIEGNYNPAGGALGIATVTEI